MYDLKKNLKKYLDTNLEKNDNLDTVSFGVYEDLCSTEISKEASLKFSKAKTMNISNINDYINDHNEFNDFQTTLFKLIDDRNLKDSDVYNKVHIDRRLFSKIRSDKNYHPSKETIILLGIALELSENELDNLLDSASYSLPKNNIYDLIIRFCFINKIFKLTDINDLLFEYKCKLFNY